MTSLNMTRIIFMNRPSAPRIRQYLGLAYQTATDHKLFPTEILIRSGIHPTTYKHGMHVTDENGLHLTLCFKDAKMLANGTHVASHGYVTSITDKYIRTATHTPEKPDSTPKNRDGDHVWPKDKEYYEINVAFGHIPSESELSE